MRDLVEVGGVRRKATQRLAAAAQRPVQQQQRVRRGGPRVALALEERPGLGLHVRHGCGGSCTVLALAILSGRLLHTLDEGRLGLRLRVRHGWEVAVRVL